MPEYVNIASLWLPILVSSVVVFFASYLAWMVLPHHRHDWETIPDEEGLMKAMRDAGVKQGQYAFPNCGGDPKAMKDPEYIAKMEKGPVGMMLIGPDGPPRMGPTLSQYFAYTLVIGIFVAYLTTRAVPAGADFLSVFRFAGMSAFLAYGMALLPSAMFKGQTWSSVIKEVLDSLGYGLVTAVVFGLFWPGA